MPRTSRTLGRWQIVVGGVATETQVAFLTGAQARAIACPVPEDAKVSDGGLTSNVPGDGDMLTLRDACDEGIVPGGYEAAKKRLQRTQRAKPTPVGKRGNADLYRRTDLVAWAGLERVS